MKSFLFCLLVSLLASLILTPLVLRLALRHGMVDPVGVDDRRVHTTPIPRVGGVAIVLAFLVPIFGVFLGQSDVWVQFAAVPQQAVGLLGGGLLIAVLGFYDDRRGASPRLKLFVQVAIASAVYALGFRVTAINLPLLPPMELGWLSYPLTLLWIVGITNAVNLIDGLDGLAAGLALLGLVPVVIKGILLDSIELGMIGCSLIGALLGFVVFNFHPARIFMGDTGSMFLGFVLSLVTVRAAQKGPAAVSVLVPILALGIPIMDTLLTIARRAWFGNPLFGADRGHIHHRLLDAGLPHRKVVLVLYGVSTLFVIAAVAVQFVRDPQQAMVLFFSLVVAGLLMRRLGYLAIDPLRLSSELRDAASLRADTRRLRARVRAFNDDLEGAPSLDTIMRRFGSLMADLRVLQARLVLAPRQSGESETTWRWTPSSAMPDDWVGHTFRLDSSAEGSTLEVRWPRSMTLWQVEAPLLKSAACAVAASWAARPAAERLRSAVSIPIEHGE